jgi:hypothetical protein
MNVSSALFNSDLSISATHSWRTSRNVKMTIKPSTKSGYDVFVDGVLEGRIDETRELRSRTVRLEVERYLRGLPSTAERRRAAERDRKRAMAAVGRQAEAMKGAGVVEAPFPWVEILIVAVVIVGVLLIVAR